MSLENLVSLIQLLVAGISLYVIMMTNFKIELVHRQTNSMKDELVQSVKNAAFEAGKKEQLGLDVH